MNVYEMLLKKRLAGYKFRSDFLDAGDCIVVEAYGPAIINYTPVGQVSAKYELSKKKKDSYVFGIFKNSPVFFVVNKYSNTKMLFPYENRDQARSFQAVCRKLFKDDYHRPYVWNRGLGKEKKRGRKKKKKKRKPIKDKYSITIDDWVFLYFIYGEDVYDLSDSQFKAILECKGRRQFEKTLLHRDDKQIYVTQLLHNVSPFQDLTRGIGELWATPSAKKQRKEVAGARIQKAKEILGGRRWIPPKTQKLITGIKLGQHQTIRDAAEEWNSLKKD